MVKGIHLTGCALAVLLLLGITGRASAPNAWITAGLPPSRVSGDPSSKPA